MFNSKKIERIVKFTGYQQERLIELLNQHSIHRITGKYSVIVFGNYRVCINNGPYRCRITRQPDGNFLFEEVREYWISLLGGPSLVHGAVYANLYDKEGNHIERVETRREKSIREDEETKERYREGRNIARAREMVAVAVMELSQ